jgi:predicted TPR repeat methyltransferase
MTVRDLYNLYAPVYDLVIEASRYVGPAWLDHAVSQMPQPTYILDLACANGVLGKVLRKHFPSAYLVGMDISERMLEQAELSGCYDQLELRDLDLPLSSVQNQTVGLAVALGFSEFLLDPVFFVSEMARVLAPRGFLLMSFREYRPDHVDLAPEVAHTGGITHHAYTVDEVKSMFLPGVFIVQSIELLTGYWPDADKACPFIMVRAVRAESK